ncbi:MAG TPA: hypothetical protein VGH14_15635 [Solirubrobacterales bacterium]
MLDGLNQEQLSILRDLANNCLIGRAEDLRLLRNEDNPWCTIREVAALARLTVGLRRGHIFVPDRTVRDLVRRWVTEVTFLEEVKAEYDRELAEHEAWLALLAHLTKEEVDGDA